MPPYDLFLLHPERPTAALASGTLSAGRLKALGTHHRLAVSASPAAALTTTRIAFARRESICMHAMRQLMEGCTLIEGCTPARAAS